MMTAREIAAEFSFPLDVPWAWLTRDQRNRVRMAMQAIDASSVNGASGFHANLRQNIRKQQMIENGKKDRLT